MKTKITQSGQPCRKCGTPVVKVLRDKSKPVTDKQKYYFMSYFDCPKCHNRYMNDADKVYNFPKSCKPEPKADCDSRQFKRFFESLKIMLERC